MHTFLLQWGAESSTVTEDADLGKYSAISARKWFHYNIVAHTGGNALYVKQSVLCDSAF